MFFAKKGRVALFEGVIIRILTKLHLVVCNQIVEQVSLGDKCKSILLGTLLWTQNFNSRLKIEIK